jgi:hypothetical protein
MAIELELLRSCILEALRRTPGTQYRTLDIDTAAVARERGLPIREGRETHLEVQDMRRFRETLWALVVEGVVAIGMNDSNEQWPWLSLTEYGEEVVKGGPPTPYDPAGYFATLAEQKPLDAIEERFLRQAVTAFRHNLPDAASVMLGATSEHLVILLGEGVEASDTAVATAARKRLDGPVLGLLTWLQRYFDERRSSVSRDLRETLDTTFFGIAGLIRSARNDAGHPTLAAMSREQTFVNLQLYPPYRQWVLDAIDSLPLSP